MLRRLPSVAAGVEEVLLLDSSAAMLDRARQQRAVTQVRPGTLPQSTSHGGAGAELVTLVEQFCVTCAWWISSALVAACSREKQRVM